MWVGKLLLTSRPLSSQAAERVRALSEAQVSRLLDVVGPVADGREGVLL